MKKAKALFSILAVLLAASVLLVALPVLGASAGSDTATANEHVLFDEDYADATDEALQDDNGYYWGCAGNDHLTADNTKGNGDSSSMKIHDPDNWNWGGVWLNRMNPDDRGWRRNPVTVSFDVMMEPAGTFVIRLAQGYSYSNLNELPALIEETSLENGEWRHIEATFTIGDLFDDTETEFMMIFHAWGAGHDLWIDNLKVTYEEVAAPPTTTFPEAAPTDPLPDTEPAGTITMMYETFTGLEDVPAAFKSEGEGTLSIDNSDLYTLKLSGISNWDQGISLTLNDLLPAGYTGWKYSEIKVAFDMKIEADDGADHGDASIRLVQNDGDLLDDLESPAVKKDIKLYNGEWKRIELSFSLEDYFDILPEDVFKLFIYTWCNNGEADCTSTQWFDNFVITYTNGTGGGDEGDGDITTTTAPTTAQGENPDTGETLPIVPAACVLAVAGILTVVASKKRISHK